MAHISPPSPSLLIFSFHNWYTNRLGGFHKIAEAFCEVGYQVGFVSEGRSVYNVLLRRDDRYHLSAYASLIAGQTYDVAGGRLTNFATPDLQLPGRIRKGPMRMVNRQLRRLSHKVLLRRCKRLFPSPEVIFLESTGCVQMLPLLKRAYRGVPILYRPSDPINQMILRPSIRQELVSAEMQVTLQAQRTIVRHQHDTASYLQDGYAFAAFPQNPTVLPNGAEINSFTRAHNVPKELSRDRRIACYVGGVPPDYDCILHAAKTLPQVQFVIVCPEAPTRTVMNRISNQPNCIYVPGIRPTRVPEYVCNSDVILIPYPALYRLMHGKVWQAMAARKPIVCYGMPKELERYGIDVAENYEEFAIRVGRCAHERRREYPSLDLHTVDWSVFKLRVRDIATTVVSEGSTVQGKSLSVA